METRSYSLDLWDILRERLDECAQYKPGLSISNELMHRWLSDGILTEEEEDIIRRSLLSRCLEVFLRAKEQLVLPEDGLEQVATEFVKRLDIASSHFGYQDFYAYQFLNKLPDIVRRALRVRDVFAKGRVPKKVKKTCREAYLSFLYGHHAASVALCRTVVESTLEEKVPREKGVGGLGVYKLGEVAHDRGILSREIWEKYEHIRRQANRCIHDASSGKRVDEEENLRVIELTQSVLQELLK